jgi:hypothetical protein
MVGFTGEDHARVASGEITVTWRLWKYSHVRPGKSYANGWGGGIFVEDVRRVRVADVSDADAREVGLRDAKALVELARSHTGREVEADTPLYRVQFHYLDQAPEKPRLSLDEVRKRIARLDAASSRGPWTAAVLRQIERNSGVVARELAREIDWPRDDFKVHVRKLKALGLTESLMVGYELSELGQEYLDSLE